MHADDAHHGSADVKARVAEYDLTDQKLAANPYPVWEEFRAGAGMTHCTGNGGFWAFATYSDVVYASGRVDQFCSGQGVAIPPLPYPLMPPIEFDPPMHGKYRRILNAWFSPGRARAQEPEIRALAVELLEPLQELKEFDFATAYAMRLPERITHEMLRIPEDQRASVGEWTDIVLRQRSRGLEHVMPAALSLQAFLTELIEQRRAMPQENDLLSTMIAADIDGRPMDDVELRQMTQLLINAGLDTTAMAISVSAWYLAEHPDLRHRLRAEPELIPSAVEEFLRWTSPVPFEGRTVVDDIGYRGCPMAKGEKIALLLGSANRDETEFPDPNEFIVDRTPNRHVAFGVGIHRCLGSNVARVTLRVTLEELLRRIPEFHVTDPAGLSWTTSETRGLNRLPLTRG